MILIGWSCRLEIKVALANYKEIEEGRGTKNGGLYLDISHKDKEFILDKLPKIHRQFIESQMIDISESPMEVAPTAHYSMGGIVVNPEEHSTNISGLYACGEVTGGLHGANRLGGNSLAEILVFGKRAGKAAAEFSKNLNTHNRDITEIHKANKSLDSKIKKGNELGMQLEYEIKEMMWKCCGVIREETKLKNGLKKLDEINMRSKNIDVRINKEGFADDLISAFNIEASIIASKITLLSALQRTESRGSHQRSDFPEKEQNQKYNIKVKLDKSKNLIIYKSKCAEINEELQNLVNTTKEINNFEGKLIE